MDFNPSRKYSRMVTLSGEELGSWGIPKRITLKIRSIWRPHSSFLFILSWWLSAIINIQEIFSLARDWSKRVTWLNSWSLAEWYSSIFEQNRACCKKYLKDNNHNSLHMARKYAPLFARGHYPFLKAHSLPRASLSENCSFLGTDHDVRGQISENIFAPSGGCCLFIQCL